MGLVYTLNLGNPWVNDALRQERLVATLATILSVSAMLIAAVRELMPGMRCAPNDRCSE